MSEGLGRLEKWELRYLRSKGYLWAEVHPGRANPDLRRYIDNGLIEWTDGKGYSLTKLGYDLSGGRDV